MAAYDEMVDGSGGVRRHWRAMHAASARLDPDVLGTAAARVARLAEAEGLAAAGEGRPGWICDPLPLPLPAAEFAVLAAGLTQRARLFEALLTDLHGPQQALAAGALPCALVFANPGFERACHGVPGPFLHAYAADLTRGPDGQWRVLADRLADAPGAGFASEVRRALARVLPELYRATPIEPVQPFFEAWQDSLIRPAPGLAPGFVAVLSPGAADPGWPGHLALARALGCAVVEPRDLIVHRGAVTLNALGARRRVDVLLRQVPSHGLDPLEMPGFGANVAGVAGLLDAVRGGAVQVLNGIGTEVAQAPALSACLPALCRNLLGEPLRLPAVPTLWLADAAARATVRQNVARWAVRPAMDDAELPSTLHDLAAQRRAVLDAAIADRPWDWAASSLAAPSTAPCMTAAGIEARPVVLRMFLVRDGARWRTMPGGLARVLPPGKRGGGRWPERVVVKDVLVLRDGEDSLSNEAPRRRVHHRVRRALAEFPGRVAAEFYALGRCLERLDGQARVGRVALARSETPATPRNDAERAILARCLAETGVPVGDDLAVSLRSALGPGGRLAGTTSELERHLNGLRDRLTGEVHGALCDAIRAVRAKAAEPGRDGEAIAGTFAALIRLARLASGIGAEEGARSGGWRFVELGRRVERARAGAAVLAVLLEQPLPRIEAALGLALEISDRVVMYHARYGAAVQPAAALDLLVADDDNPRSLSSQLARATALLTAMEGGAALASQADMWRARADEIAASVREAADPADMAPRAAPALRAVAAGVGSLAEAVPEAVLGPPLGATVVGLDAA